ncbi:MAG: hypothetical protein MRY21_01200 [Simkaniaceae bacterium]|nr:hypothetical protein [Simkaniaceae bacterium]
MAVDTNLRNPLEAALAAREKEKADRPPSPLTPLVAGIIGKTEPGRRSIRAMRKQPDAYRRRDVINPAHISRTSSRKGAIPTAILDGITDFVKFSQARARISPDSGEVHSTLNPALLAVAANKLIGTDFPPGPERAKAIVKELLTDGILNPSSPRFDSQINDLLEKESLYTDLHSLTPDVEEVKKDPSKMRAFLRKANPFIQTNMKDLAKSLAMDVTVALILMLFI